MPILVFIYDLAILFYSLSIRIWASSSPKAKSWVQGREKLFSRWRKNMSSIHGRKIWFHCASLGEFEQARPLIEKIKKLHPEHKIILTFFSPSGYNVRRNYDGADYVGYLPLDTASNAEKFIEIIKPELVIWVKYEYWYHFLHELKTKGVPVILISSIFRKGHIFFHWYGALHRQMLGYFSHIFVQNNESKELLQTIGINAEVCPDTRFDRVVAIAQQRKEYDSIAEFKGDKKLLIAGSTWTKDADIICKLINEGKCGSEFKYIIAPHDVTRSNLDHLLANIHKPEILVSNLSLQNAGNHEVVIIDSVGALASLYYYGDIAYVGGGFNASIHNILEPAVYGMPVIFGPNHNKSAEAQTLLSNKEWNAAFSISTYDELTSVMDSLLSDNERFLQTGKQMSKEYVLANTGGTDTIYSYLTSQTLL